MIYKLSQPSTSLVDLEIQDNSLAQCSSVKWERLTHLHTIAIGDNCFTEASSLPMILSICSFPSLQSVTIGNNSFRYWKEFRLNELPALTTLQIGTPGQESNCFVSASLVIRSWHTLLVSWIDLQQLKEIRFADNAFRYSESMIFESRLLSGTVRDRLSFLDNYSAWQIRLSWKQLFHRSYEEYCIWFPTFQDLPVLHSLTGQGNNFENVTSLQMHGRYEIGVIA